MPSFAEDLAPERCLFLVGEKLGRALGVADHAIRVFPRRCPLANIFQVAKR
jgi:hypothetical protein